MTGIHLSEILTQNGPHVLQLCGFLKSACSSSGALFLAVMSRPVARDCIPWHGWARQFRSLLGFTVQLAVISCSLRDQQQMFASPSSFDLPVYSQLNPSLCPTFFPSRLPPLFPSLFPSLSPSHSPSPLHRPSVP